MARESPVTEDPWPTQAEALAAAGVIAEQAAKLYGDELKGVWLYGSRARGDNGPDSDLDVLVVKRSKNFDPRDHLHRKLRRVLVPEHFDDLAWIYVYIHVTYAEKFEEWDTMFFRNVRADAIPVA
ncbi:MAG: nucleotidyltransferase domain-containing protein [Acidimicrobiia bacterium]|nr:nucleotidyltransferase domain-containing protein [Acidimicrobiia bacterium]MYF83545.1 nucleotidyltransferase domain-containing protein [Acidimicrobiia bacterium]